MAAVETRTRTDPGSRTDPPAGFWFDAAEAASAVRWIEQRCHHWQDPFTGKRFVLELWQRHLVEDLVGWKRTDGSLRYRWIYLEVPKGNGKTPFGAVLVLLGLHWSRVEGAEIYSVAGDREQARLVFADVRGMTLQSQELMDLSVLYTNRVLNPRIEAEYKVLSAEAPTKHGPRPKLVVFDELHVQPNRKLFDTLKAGVAKRVDSQLVMLTTAGEYDEESLCWQEHEYALATLRPEDGIDDPSYYAVVYAAQPGEDVGDEEVWRRCNPNLGVSISVEGLRDEYRRARLIPAELSSFKQLRLNLWAQESECVIDMEAWRDKCVREPVYTGRCFVGMDLSSKLDLTSAVAFFPDTCSVLPFFWVPKENLEDRKRRDVFDYPRWVEQGFITTTEGNKVDQRAIRNQIVHLSEEFDLVEVGFDSWNATQMETWLQDEDGIEVTEVRQGSKTLSEPFKEVVGWVLDGELRHGGHPVLTWCAGNLKARRDPNDGWAPAKDPLGRKRIDGMVALIMAVARALGADEGDPGVVVL